MHHAVWKTLLPHTSWLRDVFHAAIAVDGVDQGVVKMILHKKNEELQRYKEELAEVRSACPY